jgi:folate-dependent phosphoribosylglycinamide formyltransferase PurN
VEVLPTDNPDSLAEKIHVLEHAHYPKVIAEWLKVK